MKVEIVDNSRNGSYPLFFTRRKEKMETGKKYSLSSYFSFLLVVGHVGMLANTIL
jgi:hypothetical protein